MAVRRSRAGAKFPLPDDVRRKYAGMAQHSTGIHQKNSNRKRCGGSRSARPRRLVARFQGPEKWTGLRGKSSWAVRHKPARKPTIPSRGLLRNRHLKPACRTLKTFTEPALARNHTQARPSFLFQDLRSRGWAAFRARLIPTWAATAFPVNIKT